MTAHLVAAISAAMNWLRRLMGEGGRVFMFWHHLHCTCTDGTAVGGNEHLHQGDRPEAFRLRYGAYRRFRSISSRSGIRDSVWECGRKRARVCRNFGHPELPRRRRRWWDDVWDHRSGPDSKLKLPFSATLGREQNSTFPAFRRQPRFRELDDSIQYRQFNVPTAHVR